VASLCDESSGALGKDLVTKKQYSCVSASTTWTRRDLVPTDTTGLIMCQEFAFSHPCLHFCIYSHAMLACLYFPSVVSC
jgi:hypothetical protein